MYRQNLPDANDDHKDRESEEEDGSADSGIRAGYHGHVSVPINSFASHSGIRRLTSEQTRMNTLAIKTERQSEATEQHVSDC